MDGSLIFDTKIDTKGFDDGVKKIDEKGKNAGGSLEDSLAKVEAVSDKTGRGIVNNFRKAKAQLDETTQQAIELKRQISSIETGTKEGLKGIVAPFSGQSYEESLSAMTKDSLAKNKDYQKLLVQYDELNNKLSQQRENYYQTGNAVNDYIKSLKNSAEQIKKVNKNVEETNRKSQQVVRNYREVKAESNSLGKAINKLARRFRLLIVAMLMRGAIRAVKEGFEDLAGYSERFNKTISEMKSSFTQARNSISTAFAPILEALAPTIIKITDAFSKLMETVTMYTTALFTNSTQYIRAKKSADNYASSVKKVGKALASFDTIERLTQPSGGVGSNVQDMFETVDIPQDVLDNAKKMKEEFEVIKKNLPLLALLATATYLLSRAFKNKNGNLEEQTKDTKLEREALKSLIPQLAGAGAGAWALGDGIRNLNENPMETPSIDAEGFREQLGSAGEGVYAFGDQTQQANETVGNALNGMEETFQTTNEGIANSNQALIENLVGTKDSVKTSIDEMKNAYTDLSPAVDDANTNLNIGYDNLENNSEKLSTNMIDNVKKVAIAFMLYPAIALKQAGNNFATWGTETSKNIVTWGTNMIDNIGKTMKSWYETFTSALTSAWEAFTGFMEGAGERIANWWSGAKEWVVPTALTLGAVALVGSAIATGGATLPLLALANGTVVPPNNGEFLAMLGDNHKETEIVSPLSTMKQAVREVMAEMGQQDLTATVPVYWNGEKIYEQIEKVKARRGSRLVRGGI